MAKKPSPLRNQIFEDGDDEWNDEWNETVSDTRGFPSRENSRPGSPRIEDHVSDNDTHGSSANPKNDKKRASSEDHVLEDLGRLSIENDECQSKKRKVASIGTKFQSVPGLSVKQRRALRHKIENIQAAARIGRYIKTSIRYGAYRPTSYHAFKIWMGSCFVHLEDLEYLRKMDTETSSFVALSGQRSRPSLRFSLLRLAILNALSKLHSAGFEVRSGEHVLEEASHLARELDVALNERRHEVRPSSSLSVHQRQELITLRNEGEAAIRRLEEREYHWEIELRRNPVNPTPFTVEIAREIQEDAVKLTAYLESFSEGEREAQISMFIENYGIERWQSFFRGLGNLRNAVDEVLEAHDRTEV
jgi:hypothetical protein